MGSDLPAYGERPSQGASTPPVQLCSSEDQRLVLSVFPAADLPPSTPFQRYHVQLRIENKWSEVLPSDKVDKAQKRMKTYNSKCPKSPSTTRTYLCITRIRIGSLVLSHITLYQYHHTHTSPTPRCSTSKRDVIQVIFTLFNTIGHQPTCHQHDGGSSQQ